MSFVTGEDTGDNCQSRSGKYINKDLVSGARSAVEWNLVYLEMDAFALKKEHFKGLV